MARKTKVLAGKNQGVIQHEGVKDSLGDNIRQGMASGLFNGATVGVVTPQGREIVCAGLIEKEGPALLGNEIYDIASLTKAVLTAATLSIIRKKKGKGFNLEAFVNEYIPFKGRYSRDLRVHHLLRFTASFLHSDAVKRMVANGEDPFTTICDGGLTLPPGTCFEYCNHSSILLGKVLESVSGINLDGLFESHIFSPLGMNETNFIPGIIAEDAQLRFVPTEGLLRGCAHDEGARAMIEKNGEVIGSAGLFSTASDMLKFLAMFIDEGLSPSQGTIIPKDVVRRIGFNYIPKTGEKFGNGFGLWSRFCRGFDSVMAPSNKGFFKGAYTGCYLFCFPADKIGFFIGTDFLALGDRNKKPLHEWAVKTVSDVLRLRRSQKRAAREG